MQSRGSSPLSRGTRGRGPQPALAIAPGTVRPAHDRPSRRADRPRGDHLIAPQVSGSPGVVSAAGLCPPAKKFSWPPAARRLMYPPSGFSPRGRSRAPGLHRRRPRAAAAADARSRDGTTTLHRTTRSANAPRGARSIGCLARCGGHATRVDDCGAVCEGAKADFATFQRRILFAAAHRLIEDAPRPRISCPAPSPRRPSAPVPPAPPAPR